MSELVDWLRARLDEDEAAARYATFCDGDDPTGDDFTEWQVDAPNPKWPVAVKVANGTPIIASGYNGAYEHIARWDPARVLAEVAAKRRILDEHPCGEPVDEPWCWSKVPWCERCSDADDGPTDYPCLTVRLLALPYAGRDGWREEWRPE